MHSHISGAMGEKRRGSITTKQSYWDPIRKEAVKNWVEKNPNCK
jgi:hypothetical protein